MEKSLSDISTLYESTLVLPREKPALQFMLCPVGLVGAGKTTVLKPLSEKLSLLRLSTDEVRKLLKEHGQGYDAVVDIITSLANKYLDAGYSIAFDNDCASPITRERIAQREKEHGAIPIWIHINPPEEFIFNKLRTYKHTWLFKDGEAAIENYLAKKPSHQNLDMPFVYVFDPSRVDLAYQIDEAAILIKDKLADIGK